MSLHHSKRTAILQWFNSFSTSDLSKITDLADGKQFCDIISSVFSRKLPIDISDLNSSTENGFKKSELSEHLPDVKSSDELILNSSLENICNPESVSIGYEEKDCGANRNKVEKPVTIKISVPDGVDLDTNSETEPYPFDIDTTDPSDTDKIKKDIRNEISKVLGSESDIFSVEENKENKLEDGKKENSLVVTPSSAKKRGRPRHSTKSLPQLKGESSGEQIDVVEQRFGFVKSFVDEMFAINTGTLVDYFLCKQSNELELGKVGVLILSLVVKLYIKENMRENLDTLTLLDVKVQEDIEECLTMVLQEGLSQKELHRLLTSHAKYKISPRKSPRLCTPVRSNSKMSASVMSMTISREDVFCDSPLKSYLDSPLLKKTLISKDQELIKARRVLHAEEVRAEELELEVNDLKKHLDAKDKEIQKLKTEIRELKSKEEEEKECEECVDLKDKLKSNEALIKDLKAEVAEKDKQYEEEHCKLTSQITMLQGKIQLLKRMQNESSTNAPENVAEVVKIKEEEISTLKSSNRRLKAQLEEMLRNYSFVQSQLNASRNHDEKDESSIPLPTEECIGSVIEEENKVLRKKLLKAAATLENMLNRWKIKESIAEDFRMHFSFLTCSDSKLFDASLQSERSRTPSFVDLDATNLSKSGSFSNLSSASLATPTEMKLRRQPSRKRKSSCSSMRSESSVVLGSLWAQYQEHTPLRHSPRTIDDSKRHLLKQLGFSESDYPSKMEVIKKSLSLLRDLFYQNGSNGVKNFPYILDLDQTLMSEEECLKCLICIRDSLSSFKMPVPEVKSEDKESQAADSTECCDDKVDVMDQLQKANEELQVKLSKTIAMSSAELEEKISEIRELSSQLETVELQNKELSASKELLQDQNIELRKKLDTLKSQVSKMASKVTETEKMKGLYASLINEKNENEKALQQYKKQLRMCREKFLSFELQKKEFAAIREKEKANMREMATQIELFKNELISMKVQKRNLEKYIKDLKSKNDHLASLQSSLEEELKKQEDLYQKVVADLDHATKLPETHVTHTQNIENNLSVYVVNREGNKDQSCNNLNVPGHNEVFHLSAISNSTEPQGRALSVPEIVHSESCLENSMSTSVFNKSVHHGSLMMFTEDEEDFLNHSSVPEFKKDYDPASKGERLRELKRRNTLYLPHMQSSYPVELQTMSPFSMSLYEHIKNTPQAKKQTKSEESQHQLGESLLKKTSLKRKNSEQPSIFEAGTSSAAPETPVTKARKAFKTPASLKKLLQYRKKIQRGEFSKTNR